MADAYTCWTLIRDAADGLGAAREDFARRYEPVLRAYLGARWRGSPRAADVDDAVQEIFVECLKGGGALERVDPEKGSGFRAFLYGVARRVALRYETGHGRKREARLPTAAVEQVIPKDEAGLSKVFDQAFAQSVMRDAVKRQTELAAERGEDAQRRVELLRLRFEEGHPSREIARLWDTDPALVHRAYAKARAEFQDALIEVIQFNGADSREAARRRAEELLRLLA